VTSSLDLVFRVVALFLFSVSLFVLG